MIGWSRSFYFNDESKTFSLINYETIESGNHGLCLILDNFKFRSMYDNYRVGSISDRVNILSTFLSLEYDIASHSNFAKPVLVEFLKDLHLTVNFKKYSFLCVFILSHGDDDKIKLSDGEDISIEEILEFFSDDKLPDMSGKKKLFFIQACRGGIILF
jgi:hypothetical protein